MDNDTLGRLNLALTALSKIPFTEPEVGKPCAFVHQPFPGSVALYPGKVLEVERYKTGAVKAITISHPGKRGGGAKSQSRLRLKDGRYLRDWDDSYAVVGFDGGGRILK